MRLKALKDLSEDAFVARITKITWAPTVLKYPGQSWIYWHCPVSWFHLSFVLDSGVE